MYKAMGAAGVDIGGVHNFEMFAKILQRAAEIGPNWEQFKDNLCWPAEGPVLSLRRIRREGPADHALCDLRQAVLRLLHRAILDPKYTGLPRVQEDDGGPRRRQRQRRDLQALQQQRERLQVPGVRLRGVRRLLPAGEFRPVHDGRLREGHGQRPVRRRHRRRPLRQQPRPHLHRRADLRSRRVGKRRTEDRGRRTATLADDHQQAPQSRPCSTPHPSSTICSGKTIR